MNDRLISVAYSTSPATSQTYLYEYILPFALTGIIDENQRRFTTWSYDSSGRVTSSQHANGADLTQVSYNSDGTRTVTNPLGQQETYTFTTLQGVPKVAEIDRLATSTTAAATRTFTYDPNGYKASETDWNGNLTIYTNDMRGLPLSVTQASGSSQERTVTATYDATFHLPTEIVASGLTTDFTYDASGNLLTRTLTDTTTTTLPYSTNGNTRTWTYTWDANGLLTSAKGPRTDVGELTYFNHDGSGTLISVTNALGQRTQVAAHTPGGLPQTILDPNGVITDIAYDERLRLSTSSIHTAAGELITSYGYDDAGDLLVVILPDGSLFTDSYDQSHRLTKVSDIFNQATAYTLDAAGDRTQINVTDSGNTVRHTHNATFDALGRLIQKTPVERGK